MKIFAALSMLFGAQACTGGGQCSCPTRGFSKTTALDGTYCYTRVANPVSYDEAKAACIQLNENATLPLVNSAEDLVAWSDLTSNRFVDSHFYTDPNHIFPDINFTLTPISLQPQIHPDPNSNFTLNRNLIKPKF